MRLVRIGLVVLLAANVAVGATLAPEHMHERDDHHPTATVHRHVAPHHVTGTRDHSRLDDDDDHVVWLTAAWLHVDAYHGPALASVPAAISAPVTPTATWSALVLDDAAPPHGPPRHPRSLRAPPSSPSLT